MKKYFLPLSPTVSLNNCAIKLYISSDINCILVGTSERGVTVSVKKSVITATVIIIDKEEFVKEMSYPPISVLVNGIISNCSSGLCFSPFAAIYYKKDYCKFIVFQCDALHDKRLKIQLMRQI